RTTARTGFFAASKFRANSPPTFPVIPVIANIVISSGFKDRQKIDAPAHLAAASRLRNCPSFCLSFRSKAEESAFMLQKPGAHISIVRYGHRAKLHRSPLPATQFAE